MGCQSFYILKCKIWPELTIRKKKTASADYLCSPRGPSFSCRQQEADYYTLHILFGHVDLQAAVSREEHVYMFGLQRYSTQQLCLSPLNELLRCEVIRLSRSSLLVNSSTSVTTVISSITKPQGLSFHCRIESPRKRLYVGSFIFCICFSLQGKEGVVLPVPSGHWVRGRHGLVTSPSGQHKDIQDNHPHIYS